MMATNHLKQYLKVLPGDGCIVNKKENNEGKIGNLYK